MTLSISGAKETPAWRTLSRAPSALWPPAIALGLVLVALIARPLLPVDETRYLAVAWEMHQGGDWLTPHLNGHTYAHKPPFLFWLINLGWLVGGPSEFVGRAIPALFYPVTVWLTGVLGSRLAGPETGQRAAFIATGTTALAIFGSLVMFDALLASAVLAGLIGLTIAADGRVWRGFVITGLAIGAGILIKGPAVLIHIAPAAVLAPLWAPRETRWLKWSAGLVVAVVLGGALALAWALPAAWNGGEAFANEIFWGQTAGRMVKAFDHARPVWYFAALAPLLLMPWVFSPNVWRGLRELRTETSAWRLPMIVAASDFAIFSLISGKQAHYLLPSLPMIAIILAMVLKPGRAVWPEFGFTGLLAVLGVVLIAAPISFSGSSLHPLSGWLLLAGAGAVWFAQKNPVIAGVVTSTSLFICLHVAGANGLFEAQSLRWLGERLSAEAPSDIAFAGEYAGEFTFAARLTAPVAEITPAEVPMWLASHPGGCVTAVLRDNVDIPIVFDEVRPYRGGTLGLACGQTQAR